MRTTYTLGFRLDYSRFPAEQEEDDPVMLSLQEFHKANRAKVTLTKEEAALALDKMLAAFEDEVDAKAEAKVKRQAKAKAKADAKAAAAAAAAADAIADRAP